MAEDLIGHRLGPYRITEYLGHDGLIEVYRGYDPDSAQHVTIKFLGRGLQPDPVFSTRFRRDAKLIASLHHPNIVRVHDFGESEMGHYVVCDEVQGLPLVDVLSEVRAGRRYLDPEDASFIVRQIASALDHAHSQGVVHGAVNPFTIYVTRSGQALLADFGLALLVSQHAERAEIRSSYNIPEYRAPELQTDVRAASPEADVYSLGVVLYELLTGDVPFQLDSEIDRALRDLSDTAPDPRLLDTEIPRAVALVAMTALATSPRDRFHGAMKFATALEEAYTHGTPPAELSERITGNVAPVVEPVDEINESVPDNPDDLAGRPSRREARQARRRGRSGEPGERRRPPLGLRLLGALGNLIAVIVILGLVAAGLHLLGVIDVPYESGLALLDRETPAAASETGLEPTITPIYVVITDTPAPSATPFLTATPLQVAESTAVAPMALAELEPGETAFRLADGAAMQFVPEGLFLMGTDDPERMTDAQPRHSVMLSDYWIDRTEVTNERYALCVEAGLCEPPVDRRFFDSEDEASHPVTYVRYTGAVAYCLWVAQETGQPVGLPTEAQWEKAAVWDPAAEVAYTYPWGNQPPDGDLLRYAGSSVSGTAPVGSYPDGASAYGALDMAGNVWEWTADWYDEDAYKLSGIAVDPTGPASGSRRVTRGGGWLDEPALLVSSVRNWAAPTAAGDDLGFRCALNAGQPAAGSDVYLAPLDVTDALLERVAAGQGSTLNDAETLAGWATGLTALRDALAAGDDAGAQEMIDELLVGLSIDRGAELIEPRLAVQLDGALQWMQAQLAG